MGILEVVEWPLHGGLPGIVQASGCHVEGGPRGLVRVCVEWLTLSQWVPLGGSGVEMHIGKFSLRDADEIISRFTSC